MREPTLPAGVLSVSALARSVRDILETRFPLLWVSGEISNYMRARSGHSYFVLKDELSQVRCVMFRHRSQYMDWMPADGMQVEVQALVTLYEARGEFQLNIESMRRAGVGVLYERFLKLRDQLERQGLFAAELKRALPAYPRTIGVITSLKAAALRDVLTTLRRRNPSINVIVYPVQVQGDVAAGEVAKALEVAGHRAECDVIILARGGGSIEDLWAFNEERVARAIRACPIPVVSGIGHETDITIADLAADRRAPTPTAAAELVSPDAAELSRRINALAQRVSSRTRRSLENGMQRLDANMRRLEHPRHRIELQMERLRGLKDRQAASWLDQIDRKRWMLSSLLHRGHKFLPRPDESLLSISLLIERLCLSTNAKLGRLDARATSLRGSLDHLSPMLVLARGYSVVRDEEGRVIRDASTISAGDRLDISLASGGITARVESNS